MPGLSGRGTTYNLPNFHGDLIEITPSDTPFLTAIGGLSAGGDDTAATEFEWQYVDLRSPDDSRQRLEGADAPTAEERVRANITNVVEIHQEAIDVSYTKQAASQQYAGSNTGGKPNPVTDESAFQVTQQLKQVKRDLEQGLLTSTYQKPVDNSTPRKTRGLIQAAGNTTDKAAASKAITAAASTDLVTSAAHGYTDGDTVVFSGLTGGTGLSNDKGYFVVNSTTNTFKVALTPGGTGIDITVDYSAGNVQKCTALDEAGVLSALQKTWEDGGIRESEAATIIANAWNKRQLTKIFITQKGYIESTRNVGGVALSTIHTDFGDLNIMLSRYMPAHKVLIASLEQCEPIFLNIPQKGFLFVEDLAKSGASDKKQLYGEVGLRYGNPYAHHVVKGLTIG